MNATNKIYHMKRLNSNETDVKIAVRIAKVV